MPVAELVEPAYLWVPGSRISSTGDEAIDLCGQVGLPLDPEQELALDAVLAEKRVELPDGSTAIRWAGLEACIIAPRQNVKTHTLKAVTVTDLWLLDAPLVTWTAHEFATAEETFLDILSLIDQSPLLSRRVKDVARGKGDQGIELHPPPGWGSSTGPRLEFRARTKSAGRGLTGRRIILDEGFALLPSHLGSLLPTLAAQSVTGNPQVIYASSAGNTTSAVLRTVRDRGRAGVFDPAKGDPGLVYIEWCAPEGTCEREDCDHRPGTPGCAADDMDQVAKANLALDRRISRDYVISMRRAMPPEEFVREFLGWWDEPEDVAAAIDMVRWEERGVVDDPVTPAPAAIDASPGLKSGAIVSYGGIAFVAEHGAGTNWMSSRLASLKRDGMIGLIGVDAGSPAAAVVPILEKPEAEGGAGLTVRSKSNPNGDIVLLTGREMSSATELMLAAVNTPEGTYRHRKQAVLNEAAAGAYLRRTGDSCKWSRRSSSIDISTLVASTIAHALWAQQTAPKPPAKPQLATGTKRSETADLATMQF